MDKLMSSLLVPSTLGLHNNRIDLPVVLMMLIKIPTHQLLWINLWPHPEHHTSNNPTSPGMTTNMRDRQTVVLFGEPGLRPHSFGRVRGGKGCRGPVKEIQQRLVQESAGGCGVRIPDEQVLSRV